jgi:hypothetical protein
LEDDLLVEYLKNINNRQSKPKLVSYLKIGTRFEESKSISNLKRGAPKVFMKLNMDKITACGYTNRVPKKQAIGGIFV